MMVDLPRPLEAVPTLLTVLPTLPDRTAVLNVLPTSPDVVSTLTACPSPLLHSNMMVDLPWLLEAVPALATAQELVLVHGEGHGDRGLQEAVLGAGGEGGGTAAGEGGSAFAGSAQGRKSQGREAGNSAAPERGKLPCSPRRSSRRPHFHSPKLLPTPDFSYPLAPPQACWAAARCTPLHSRSTTGRTTQSS